MVGATRVASTLRGLNMTKWLQPRKFLRCEVALAGSHGTPTHPCFGEGRCCRGSNRYEQPANRRGRGPGISGRTRRDNVGKNPLAAGAGSNLRRLLARGQGRRRGEPDGFGAWVRTSDDGGVTPSEEAEHASPTEAAPRLGKGTLDTWRLRYQGGTWTQSRDDPTLGMERGSE